MLTIHDFREMLGSEMISATVGILSGALLALYVDKLFLIPGILILLPGLLEMRGNIGGSLSARLGSGLWLRALKPKWHRNRILHGNIVATFVLVVLVSLLLGVIAYIGSAVFFGEASVSVIFVALFAGIISNIIEIPLTIATTFWLFRKGYDPNNIMGPYVTATGDIISVVSLLIAVLLI